jgi:hypothetical protein
VYIAGTRRFATVILSSAVISRQDWLCGICFVSGLPLVFSRRLNVFLSIGPFDQTPSLRPAPAAVEIAPRTHGYGRIIIEPGRNGAKRNSVRQPPSSQGSPTAGF